MIAIMEINLEQTIHDRESLIQKVLSEIREREDFIQRILGEMNVYKELQRKGLKTLSIPDEPPEE